MREIEPAAPAAGGQRLTWVRTRLALDQSLLEAVRYGFSLIAAGFGSFAVFEGLSFGERPLSAMPRAFALIVTAIGIVVIFLAAGHARRMIAWVNADEYGAEPAPALPEENRTFHLAAAAVVIGAVSFIALLLLPA
ncbi:MAG TPA: hypothetical protein VFX03_00375 [Thermomicrobiales bacterium]|nr:hypothetical protein [Thermomicrobiales bacterium]